MEPTKKNTVKNWVQKIGFDLKLSIIDQISNGQISLIMLLSCMEFLSSITYWMKKLRSFEQNSKTMSKKSRTKKLKDRIEELEFIKDFQQMIIADFEVSTNLDFAKSHCPSIAKRRRKKKKTFKIKWFLQMFRNKLSGLL